MLASQGNTKTPSTDYSDKFFYLGEKLYCLSNFQDQSQFLIDYIQQTITGDVYLIAKSISKLNKLESNLSNFPLDDRFLEISEKHLDFELSKVNNDLIYQFILKYHKESFAKLIILCKVRLDEENIQNLNEIKAIASPYLYASLQSHVRNWQQRQLELVRSVSAKISQITDLDELTEQVTQLTRETFNYYYVAFFLIDKHTKRLRFKASSGAYENDLPEFENATHPGFAMGEHMIGHVALTGQELIANDVSKETHYKQVDSLKQTKSEAVIPVKVENRIFGVFDVQSDQINGFKENDLLVLRALADNIAIAVESTYLYQNIEKRADQLAIVAEVSRAITSILNTDQLLKRIVTLIHDEFGFPYVHLYIVDPVQKRVSFKAGCGERTPYYEKAAISFDLNADKGVITDVVQHQKPRRINNVKSEPRYIESPFAEQASGSEMAVPLQFGNEILGVLDIQSEFMDAFSIEDQQLMETLADNIAISIRNAKLFRSESWRRQVTESLRDIAGLLSENTQLETILNEILTQLMQRLPCDFAGFWLFDPDATQNDPTSLQELHLSAFQTSQIYADFNIQSKTTCPDEWIKNALTSKQPSIRQPEDPIGPIATLFNMSKEYAAIAAPLHIGDTILGVLTLIHHSRGRYGQESKNLTSTFASYGAIAINNNQLYNTSQEQAWIATILLQVANAAQSITDLSELLDTIVRLTPMMIGVKGCAIFLKDPDMPFFTLRSVYNIGEFFENNEQAQIFRDVPIFEDMILTKAPLRINDFKHDFGITEENTKVFPEEDLVLLPIITHNNLLGSFLLAYDPERNQTMDQTRVISSERYKIIQGIIQQTAIGIENIRLLEEKQEEAYISTVLLQAAQAVVNNVALKDTLDALIHLMPILVGIEASAIYMWNNEEDQYKIEHASLKNIADEKELIGTTYSPGDFSILDLIKTENRSYVHPFIENILPADDWDLLVPDEGQTDPIPLIQSKYPLLIAFPLSVKDEIFGVLLAQDKNTSINRERRYELLWGISQQASLAIQNDIINQEMQERQRLEREFQLARQIQQTFLPEVIPSTPGWELDVHWETARQVGGDFYDYFFLPDGRLAFVIADVSDKGLAASLYMTVTRTLIRATAMERTSSAETLERVNDLLLVNSQNGLFVTTFYGILSLEDGELEFTIAGHNPPMLMRYGTDDVTKFNRGGTALGALPDIKLTKRKQILNPGDCLVLYTDGVTEAFNGHNQMYGEDRFLKLLQRHIGKPATQVIQAIESDLSDFRDNANLSDDTTIFAIYRKILQTD